MREASERIEEEGPLSERGPAHRLTGKGWLLATHESDRIMHALQVAAERFTEDAANIRAAGEEARAQAEADEQVIEQTVRRKDGSTFKRVPVPLVTPEAAERLAEQFTDYANECRALREVIEQAGGNVIVVDARE